ncbi:MULTISPECIES: glycosyltransferase family 2 protein [Bacillus cereus group]|uniref:glycosyltransferase family 2 protein n=1 Tax=Bacillus cereus group TaxID=86661 RepID=UPI001122AFC8|nr:MULTISPECIES: glycosyltransferase family 2 protein [Bacillus cereus group]MDW3038839.1 glycosyltransferase family 2 protein [Bacillus pacificus]TNP03323.1 glycosyltransferase family 2 protein [Bacillus pacificus]
MHVPEISIIIPTYNVEKYIEKALNSVLNQSFNLLEIIVIDDGSQDKTVSIVQSLKDKRIKLYKNESNKGPAYSRNFGISKATGHWIAFLDGDDWWDKERIKELLNFARGNDADMVFDDIFFIYDGHEHPYSSQAQNYNERMQSISNITPELLVELDLGMQPMIKRELLEGRKIKFDEKLTFGEDYVFYLDVLCESNKCYFYNKPLYFYRQRENSLTKQKSKRSEQLLQANRKLLQCKKFQSNKQLLYQLQKREERLSDLNIYYSFIEKIEEKDILGMAKGICLNPKILFILMRRLPNILKYRLGKIIRGRG